MHIHHCSYIYEKTSSLDTANFCLYSQLVESESVAQNVKSRLIEQGIPFYRFNPHLDEAIPSGETDIEKLLNMTVQSRIQTLGVQLDELIQLLHLVARLNRQHETQRKREARCDSVLK